MPGRIVLCLFLTGFFSALFAYDSTGFKIADYPPPDYRYASLEISPYFNLRGYSNRERDDSGSSMPLARMTNDLFKNTSITLNPNLYYHIYKQRFEFSSTSSVYGHYQSTPTYGFRNQGNAVQEGVSENSAPDINVASKDSLRFYYRRNSFYSFSGSLQYFAQASGQKSSSVSTPDSVGNYPYTEERFRSIRHNPDLSLSFGLGWGRIRDVTFAAVALNMLDRVQEISGKEAVLSVHDIRDFASYVEQCRRRRVFDSRLSYIQNIKDIGDYLQKKNISLGAPASSTLELADQWSYAFTQQRLSGTEFVLFPAIHFADFYNKEFADRRSWTEPVYHTPQVTGNDLVRGRTNADRDFSTSYSLGVAFRFARPLNRYFQCDGSASTSGTLVRSNKSSNSDFSQTTDESLHHEISSGLSGFFAWYPNTRTSLTLAPSCSYLHKFAEQYNRHHDEFMRTTTNTPDSASTSMHLSTPFSLIYYVSPRICYSASVTLDGNANYHAAYRINWNYNVSIGATYSIF